MASKPVGGAGAEARSAEDRILRSARRGSTMLTALTKATVASIRMQNLTDRTNKAIEEKRRRAEFAIVSSTTEQWVWIIDEKEGYLPAKVLEERADGSFEVEMGISRIIKVCKKSELGPPIMRVAEVKNHVDDMVRMSDVNEATILHNLRMRFSEDLIYTNIGSILVSINPFKFFPHLYTQDLILEHLQMPVGEISPPHVFQIAAAAYHGLKSERQNQSIIISGESGAGKTEATKKCLQFFASAAGSAAEGMENRLLSANPILEAFGNAKTVRNNNSSRFGKWMEVRFNHRAQISGCRINNYLLEKSRVVFQAPEERNYHIFYMLSSAAPLILKERFSLSGPESFSYTNTSSCVAVEGMNDGELLDELMDAFHEVGFSAEEVEDLFQMVAAVLHLSNVKFRPSAADRDRCELDPDPAVRRALDTAARLLGAEPEILKKGLEQRLLDARGERTWSPMSVEKAIDARNSMAKAVYGRMFDWLVQRVNRSMMGSVDAVTNIIGVLDIFGFEIFENNSFEQLCINYCNEKLQQHFNLHVFKEEEKCYQDEGIDYTEVRFVDNQDVLDLIELKPNGLLPVLDDECRRPGGSDNSFVEKVAKFHFDNARFKGRPKGTRTTEGKSLPAELLFGVNHYAGLVVYNAQNFMDKNKDELLLSVRETLQSSSVPFMLQLFRQDIERAASSGISGGGAKDKLSQSFQFRDELTKLMDTLNKTKPHYIRCIKPNNAKKAGVFDAQICLQQLRYAGVFEAVKIRQLGFPFRWRYDVFYKRYRCCGSLPGFRSRIPGSVDWKDGTKKLVADLTSMFPVLEGLKFGRTMVLYRADPNRILETLRDRTREAASLTLQKVFRGHRARKIARILRRGREIIRAALVGRDLAQVVAASAEADKLPFPLFEVVDLKALHKRLLEEKACKDTLSSLLPFDPVDKYAEYDAALKDATKLGLTDPLVARVQLKFDTVRERIETKANLLKGIELGDRRLILTSLAKAEELQKEWGPIVPPEALARAQEVLQIIAREEATLECLRSAILVGKVVGEVGKLKVHEIDHATLEKVIQDCLASSVRVNTQVGHNLIQTAQRVRDMRLAFVAGNWDSIEAAVAAVAELRLSGNLAPEAIDEALLAEREVAERRILRSVTSALGKGAATGRIGELRVEDIDTDGLLAAVDSATVQAQSVGGLSNTALALIGSAKIILRLRQALVSQDWNAVRRAVQEANETKMPEVSAAELQQAKDEADNHAIVHQLADALERGHPTGTVSKIHIGHIDTHLLDERISHAEEIGPKTQKAAALLRLAKYMRKVRQALQDADFARLPDLCKQALTIPSEFIPPSSREELMLSQYEAENVFIIQAFKDAVNTGGPSGLVGSLSRTSVNTTPLVAAIKKAQALRCRSDEAIWYNDVAEAALELRTRFRDGKWSQLREAILELSSLHNARPSMPVPLEDAAPVIKEKDSSKSGRVVSVRLSKPHGFFTDPTLSRGRTPSVETRSRPLSADLSDAVSRSASATDARRGDADGINSDSAFALPIAVLDECALLQDELDNHCLIEEVSKALQHGSPSGPIGELDQSTAVVDQLEAALKRYERAHVKTPFAASLMYTARTVRELRSLLKDGNWTKIEIVLDHVAANNARVVRFAARMDKELTTVQSAAIPVSSFGRIDVPTSTNDPQVLEISSLTPAEAGIVELVRFEQEAEYRHAMNKMWHALETGGPNWGTNGLDLTAMTVQDLKDGIDASLLVNARTDKSRHLTTLCRLMCQMRTAVFNDDWATVESLLMASAEVTGKTTPLPGGCAVPAPMLKELDMYRLEANNRKIVTSLASAMFRAGPNGDIGRLDIGAIDVRPLEDAIKQTLSLGCEKDEARCMLATALHLRSMRLALMGGQWERLGELLDYVQSAAQVPRSMPVSQHYASLIAPNGSVPSSKFSPQLYSNTKDGLGRPASWPAYIDDPAVLDVKLHGVSGVIAGEVDIMQLELNNRNIIVQLTAAIAKGTASGTIGHLDLSTIETGQLEWGVDFAQRIGCVTEESKQLLFTAQIIKKVRLALIAGDWSKLEQALTEAQGQLVADIGAPEIVAAQDELNNRAILSELAGALARGRPQGRTGRLFIGSIDVKPLNEAISLATKLSPKTVEARQMLFTAKVVARLRLCLLNEDLAEAGMTLEAVRGKMLASAAIPEVKLVQDEVDNWQIISNLVAAITAGAPAGDLGALDLSTVDAVSLEKAIDKAEELGVKTTEATSLLDTAKQLYRLRKALINDQWDPEDPNSVEAVLSGVKIEELADIARPEFQKLQHESENRKIIMMLSQALASGAASGPVGELNLSGVQTASLDSAIAETMELGTNTQDAAQLLAAAKLVRRLRAVLVAGNWQWVGSVLLEARNVKEIFPQVSLRELQLAQDELDNRAIIAQLTSALRVGCIAGPIGLIDVTQIDVEGLDEALTYARTLGVKSTEATQMVATAQIIRKLRSLFKVSDFPAALELLESIKGKILAAVAADEVQLARMNTDNWLVVTKVSAALSTGFSQAILGAIEPQTIHVEDLDVAIALAMKVGCHTIEARRCLVTGLVVRRLRAALLDADFPFLVQVISEADKEGEALLSVARKEIQNAKDLIAFREVIAALQRAVSIQDEAALVDALARAARLSLSEHPHTDVRQQVETATLALGRIQRCKAALAAGIKSLEVPMLIDALAMAGTIGYNHPLVDEARRVLITVQNLIEKLNVSLRSMNAVDMAQSLKECDAIGLTIPLVAESRAALSLSRADFLRKELSAILTLAAAGTTPSSMHVPLADRARAPTPVELRVVQCTLQLKDLFFADLPEVDEAALIGQFGGHASGEDDASFLFHPAASAALTVAQSQKNYDENVSGAAQRNAQPPTVGGFSWALAGDNRPGAIFRPAGTGAPALPYIGGMVPPSQSKLRKQFELSRAANIKPPHMFSRKYAVTESIESTILKWQHEPIHTSLTLLQDADHRRLAVKCFRDTLAFMGDRPLATPLALAHDLLTTGVAVPELRDEIYLQLCKQLSGNPSSASIERGWVLLHLCLSTFAPSEELENYLELFLRERGALACVWALHLTLYRGGPGLTGVPSESEIQGMLDCARAPALPVLSFASPHLSSEGIGESPSHLRNALEAFSDATSPLRVLQHTQLPTPPSIYSSPAPPKRAAPSPGYRSDAIASPANAKGAAALPTPVDQQELLSNIEERLTSMQTALSSLQN